MNLPPYSLPPFPAALLAGLICYSFLGQCASGQATEAEKLVSEKLVAFHEVEATPTLIEGEAVEAVFGRIFFVQEDVLFMGKPISRGRSTVGILDGKLVRVEGRNLPRNMPNLQSLIRKDFRLRDKTDAETFFLALDAIFPPGELFRDYKIEDLEAREIIKTGGGWTFATHAELDRKRGGFEIKTNADGAIKALHNSETISLREGNLVYLMMNEAEQELIAKAFPPPSEDKTVQTIPSPIKRKAIDTVFGDKLFSVIVVVRKDRSSRAETSPVALRAGKVLKIEEPSREMDAVPILRSLIRKDYRLRTEADAETLLDALTAVYPPRKGDREAQEVIKTEAGWLVVTGDYIGDRKGFSFSTNADGVITGIKYSRRIRPKAN